MQTIFDTNTAGSTKAAMTNAGAKSGDLWQVPYENVHVVEGFNVRVRDAAYEEHVAWLTKEMVAKGYDKTKPMAGYVVKGDDGVSHVYVTDGHSRHEAVGRARAAGATIESVWVITAPAGTSAEDLTVALVTANSGKPLSPFELATVIKRLQGYGLDEGEIAKRLSYTREYVKQLLELLAAPKAVRDMVTSGKVSATLAAQTLRKHGKDAAAVLKGGAVEAAAKGKAKVTAKHLKPAAAKKKVTKKPVQVDASSDVNAIIAELVEAVTACRVGDDYADLLARANAFIAPDEGL